MYIGCIILGDKSYIPLTPLVPRKKIERNAEWHFACVFEIATAIFLKVEAADEDGNEVEVTRHRG